MNENKPATHKDPTHVEILYWSPKGIPFTPEDREMVLDMIRTIRRETETDRKYTTSVTTVAFDLVSTGDEDQDHAENFLNIAKVCVHAESKETLHILCLREPFPVEAMSALHDVYVCSGSPYDVKLVGISKLPANFVVGLNTVMMPVVEADGSIVRWTSIY